MKNYISFNDGRIGYIKSICNCCKCKERNMAEMFIDDLEGKYLDCIKINEVSDIIYIGKSLNDAIKSIVDYYNDKINMSDKVNKYLQSLIDFYSKEILKLE